MEQRGVRLTPLVLFISFAPLWLAAATNAADEARKEIVTAYQASLDALRRGDLDAAMKMDTADWVDRNRGRGLNWNRSFGEMLDVLSRRQDGRPHGDLITRETARQQVFKSMPSSWTETQPLYFAWLGVRESRRSMD